MQTILFVIAVVVPVLTVANLAGWFSIAFYQTEERPFNWRVFIGPWAYYPWLDRRKQND